MSYAGDDTGAVVGDIGSSAFRFGTAGTPIPDFSCPSVVGRAVTSSSSSSSSSTTTSSTSSTSSTSTTQQPPPRIGEVALSTHYDTLQLHNPFVQGHLSKWSEVEDLWHHAFSKQALGLDSKETPVVFVAPSDLDDRNSAQYIETMFETFQIPSGYMLRKGVASSFAAGKTTSLVIDSGPQGTLATSVCEGFVLRKSCTRTAMGGNMLDQQVLEYIESQMPANLPVRPRFHFSKTRNSFGEYTSTTVPLEVHGSVLNYHRLAIARDLKETHCRVPHTAYNEVAAKSMPSAVYELPDGTKINVGTCRYLIPEMLMRTKVSENFSSFSFLFLSLCCVFKRCNNKKCCNKDATTMQQQHNNKNHLVVFVI
jgi:actin-like protein 6A